LFLNSYNNCNSWKLTEGPAADRIKGSHPHDSSEYKHALSTTDPVSVQNSTVVPGHLLFAQSSVLSSLLPSACSDADSAQDNTFIAVDNLLTSYFWIALCLSCSHDVLITAHLMHRKILLSRRRKSGIVPPGSDEYSAFS